MLAFLLWALMLLPGSTRDGSKNPSITGALRVIREPCHSVFLCMWALLAEPVARKFSCVYCDSCNSPQAEEMLFNSGETGGGWEEGVGSLTLTPSCHLYVLRPRLLKLKNFYSAFCCNSLSAMNPIMLKRGQNQGF